MAQTKLAGRIPVDEDKIAEELAVAAEFQYSEAYSDYICGGPWKSCMLWAAGGDSGDGVVTHYDHTRATDVTEYGVRLPYLRQLVENSFDMTHLNFGRLAVISDAVTIPHRDLLELKDIPEDARNSHRVHVPLATNSDCYFTHDNIVYQMRVGDVWFFDAAKVHGAASMSRQPRVHLILDFADAAGTALARFDLDPDAAIPAERICRRPSLSDVELDAFLGLAKVISKDNWRDVFSIVIKAHYRVDGGASFVWDTLGRIGELSDDDYIRAKIPELHNYFLMERAG